MNQDTMKASSRIRPWVPARDFCFLHRGIREIFVMEWNHGAKKTRLRVGYSTWLLKNHREVFSYFSYPSPMHKQKATGCFVVQNSFGPGVRLLGQWVNQSQLCQVSWMEMRARNNYKNYRYQAGFFGNDHISSVWSVNMIKSHYICKPHLHFTIILTIDSIILPLYVHHLLLPLIWICKLPKFGRVINWIAGNYGSWRGSSVQKKKHFHPFPMSCGNPGQFWSWDFHVPKSKKKHKYTQRLSDATKHVFNWKRENIPFMEKQKVFLQLLCLQVQKMNNFSSPCFQKPIFLLVPTNTHDQKPVSPMLLRPTLRSCSMRAP